MSRIEPRAIGRRTFLVRAGRGALGFAVLGLAACSGGDEGDTAAPKASGSSPSEESTSASSSPAGAAELSWSRVDLGFVSAYVLVRGNEAAVVDTGVTGSAGQIGEVLDEAGPGWAGVRHVVLTHKHGDHAGSVGEVGERAADAIFYAGEADLGAIEATRRLRPVADGDEVFGLQMVASPGHTAGHFAVFDADSAVLVAGDALNNSDGLSGSDPEFTEDETAAADSVRKLARLEPRVILVGHGPPVQRGAAAQLQSLAQSLG